MTTDVLVSDRAEAVSDDRQVLVTLTIAGQLCGVPAMAIRDILSDQPITRIPLAPPEIAGSLNLRGRIVTAIDLRRRLGLPSAPSDARRMSVVAEQGGELYALLVDQVSEVMSLASAAFEPNPPTLERHWAAFSNGIYPLEGSLLVVLDIPTLLAVSGRD
ncbi:chemotaxis protein CheW [Rhodopila sp.]|jgi:purine-binding chemotaxis protein CheW|uniref:chemotaxis protein CheW n=1 Tax=Rhodopila sp. TaxID=2480087 RepID=UPI002D0237CF|nr:chemotaxis protein CheW [Rhodopila sp.]HVZ09042.1 chemotaxis protein CheW [Rhodopila sp.]